MTCDVERPLNTIHSFILTWNLSVLIMLIMNSFNMKEMLLTDKEELQVEYEEERGITEADILIKVVINKSMVKVLYIQRETHSDM